MITRRCSKRCIPVSLLVLTGVCGLFFERAPAQGAAGAGAASHVPSAVSASVRAVQPAVSGLFQVHAPRAWVDAVDETGAALVNGVPDFLDAWEAFSARTSWAVLKSGYAFTTIDGLGHEVIYAGAQRASSKGPSEVVFEFNQKPGERVLGDLNIFAEILADGGIGTVRFERFADEAKGAAKFLPVAIISGEGCNDAGSACVVANGALLEVGYNETLLGKPVRDFVGIQIRTPEAEASGRLSPMFSSGTSDCVKEIGGVNNPVCTAGDVRLGEIVEGTLVVTEGCNGSLCSGGTNDGLGCNFDSDCPEGTCPDTVSFNAVARFTAGPQRYDVGVYFSTDGDPNHDGARSGDCDRFALPRTGRYCLGGDIEAKSCTSNADCTGTSPTPNGVCLSYANLDLDTCGDVNANQVLSAPLSVTIKCADNNNDGKVDIFHCETWGQNSGDVICGPADPGDPYVKSGTPSKCDCSLLTGPGACIPVSDGNPCTVDVCEGTCSNSQETGCSTDANCLIGGVQGQCQGIALVHKAGNPGTECRASTGGCDPAEYCNGTSTTCPTDVVNTGACCVDGDFRPDTFECRASAGACDVAEFCTGSSGDCPADGFQPGSLECRASAGPCDVAENCTGSSATCPADDLRPDTYECRASSCDTNETLCCDVPENCTGASATCPADTFKANTVECRATEGECDVAEKCTGSSADCPADEVVPAGDNQVCRDAENECDAAEKCNGTDKTCPGDQCKGGDRPETHFCSEGSE